MMNNAIELLKLAESRNFECYDGSVESRSHWINFLDKPIIGVDFHHTISTQCGACNSGSFKNLGDLSAGIPQRGVVAALDILSRFFEIEIFTGYGKSFNENARNEIGDYLVKHNIHFDRINIKKPSFMFQVDDRGIRHLNWDDTFKEIVTRCLIPRGVKI